MLKANRGILSENKRKIKEISENFEHSGKFVQNAGSWGQTDVSLN